MCLTLHYLTLVSWQKKLKKLRNCPAMNRLNVTVNHGRSSRGATEMRRGALRSSTLYIAGD